MLTLNKYDIFPTPLWHLEDTPQWLVEFLYNEAYSTKEKYLSENRSNQGGYQSPPFIWEEFPREPKEYFNELLGSIPFSNTTKVQLEGDMSPYGWYNINGKGSWNMPHTHPISNLALILYLTDTNNELTVINPMQHTRHFLEDSPPYTSPHLKKGDIVIFPSDLMHFVRKNESNKDRVSLSMNLQLC